MSVTLHHGDCREVLAGLEPESIDAVVCDPPYELAFMGKGWDSAGVSFDPETWRACLRVLKPGGHLLAFGGTRTVHRIAVAIEDAGFEIRDQIVWMYGSGFPKSLDVSKAMDKAAGAERQVVGNGPFAARRPRATAETNIPGAEYGFRAGHTLSAPATDLARQYAGFGTALKPAHEPLIVARKPLVGTVAANVAQYGTGALNIDGCRIAGEPWKAHDATGLASVKFFTSGNAPVIHKEPHTGGRWPANVALDEDAAAMLDGQSGTSSSRRAERGEGGVFKQDKSNWRGESTVRGNTDSGGASRFFYVAKASRAERNAGLDGMPEKMLRWSAGDQNPGSFQSDGTNRNAANHHPTVKPIALMRWLVRLVTPPDGIVCDPFLGSGTTGCAAVLEGFDFIGIEQDAEYLEIARRRIAHVQGPLFAEGAA